MDINFELYKVFYLVASNLSFSKAAQQLFISQSAVSQSIKILEKKLDIHLFLRTSKKVQLTKEGKVLFKHIEPAFHLIKNAEKNIENQKALERGEIHIAASDTICKYYLINYFKLFHKRYPSIHIQITNRTSLKCVQLLKQGKVDFVVTNLPNDNLDSNMNIDILCDFKDTFICGNSYKYLVGKQLSIKDISKYPMILLEKHTTTRKYFDNLFEKNNIKIKTEIESTSIDLMIELTKIGLGLSYVPEYCINNLNSYDNLYKLNVSDFQPKRQLALVTYSNVPLSPSCKKFKEILIEN